MKIRYNAPVTLSFSLASLLVLLLDTFAGTGFTANLFSIPGKGVFNFGNTFHYVRLFTHVIGHRDFTHFIANFSLILLLGPILEEKYGTLSLLFMMAITAVVTGLLNALIFSTGLLGASGIVFMFILLSSFTNIRQGEIPLTFILILAMYLTGEVAKSRELNSISEFTHIAGGVCGSLFGFIKPSGGRARAASAKQGREE